MRAERDDTTESEVTRLVAELVPGGLPVRSDATLAELGLDSLGVADLALGLEDRFGIRLADAPMSELRTIADVISAATRSAPGSPQIPPRIPLGIGRLQAWSKAVAGPAFFWHARLHVQGVEHMPATGPVVVACNHRSFLDIPLLVIATPRPIVFMAKRELYKNRAFGRVLHELGGFPVRREIADLRAVDVGLAVLERGEALGVYPEGTRNYGRDLLPFLRGAAWLALATGAPIVPCGIVGTERMRPGVRKVLRRRARITFGAPISPGREQNPLARREKARLITDQLFGDISALVR
jgi:1-acyl-sn-glycerol-3-phosphate acyltransferase